MNSLKLLAVTFIMVLAISGCSNSQISQTELMSDQYDWEGHVPFSTSYDPFNLPVSDDFEPLPADKGGVRMSEASGVAWSLRNPGYIWSHNDRGHTNTLFLIDSTSGEIVARYSIKGTHNIDWEDIEVSYGPIEGETYIYLADTGDNEQRRPDYSIYRFPEPEFKDEHHGTYVHIDNIDVDRIRFVYPDGSHDTEAMLVDPLTGDIYLATKRDVVSLLYVLPYPQPVNEMYEIFKAGRFSFREASAATSSISGQRVLIKNRQEIFYWKREKGESMVEMLARTPEKAPYAGEPQGEAIGFDPEYNYFTLSEELNSTTIPSLYKYTFIKK